MLNDLKPNPGARPTRRRVGRGIGSGLGKTSGKGHKGQWARSGGGVRPGFEGGQMPIYRRIPKRGFTNIFKVVFQTVNLGRLSHLAAGTVVNPELLASLRLVQDAKKPIKILANGSDSLTQPLTIRASAFSSSAKEKIESVGGKAEVI